MNIPLEMAAHLQEAFEAIPAEEPMFILLGCDLSADGHLVWNPKNSRAYNRICKPDVVPAGPHISSKVERTQKKTWKFFFLTIFVVLEAKKLGGSFLGFVPKQAADTVLVHDDGFLAMLKTEHWSLLRHCLASAMNCGIRSDNPGGSTKEFRIANPNQKKTEFFRSFFFFFFFFLFAKLTLFFLGRFGDQV